MELFFPHIARRLDLSRVAFLDTETFTDFPRGDQRDADLVAQVHTLDGIPEIILTHIEVEARRRGGFPERMSDYYRMLKLRHRLPVYPIVAYLSAGAGGLVSEQFVDSVFDEEVNIFKYQAVGLRDLQADDYQDLENPLGPALSALMKPCRRGRVIQKYRSLRAMARIGIDESRKALLTNVVETYLRLSEQELTEFDQLMTAPEGEEIREMISIYEQRGIEKGIAIGERRTLLRQLKLKFGEVPEAVRERIESLSDTEELQTLADRVVQANTLAEMGLD